MLSIAMAIGLILFHAGNISHLSRLFLHIETCGVEMRRILGHSFAVPTACSRDELALDLSTARMRNYGYILRYQLGQTPPFLVKGGHSAAGWLSLFRRQDLVSHAPEQQRFVAEVLRPRVARVIAALADKGVHVVVLPLPPKDGIQREYLPEKLPPAVIWESGSESQEVDANIPYHRLVADDPTHFVDLYGAFREQFLRDPDHPTYIPWGFHWTSMGIAIAARETLVRLQAQGVPIDHVEIEPEGLSPFTPDLLLGLFQLPDWFINSRSEFSWRQRFFAVTARQQVAPSAGRIVIAADSNGETLREEGRSLGQILAKVLRRDLVDFSVGGYGGIGSLVRLSASHFMFRKGDIFIYEFQMPSDFTAEDEAFIKLDVTD